MTVVWTPRATDELDSIVEFIGADSPDSAVRVAETILGQVEYLTRLPRMGRRGDLSGTRELVFAPLPYIAVYRIDNETVYILHVRHTSQEWPQPKRP